MPELPEVQTLVNDLNAAGLIGKTITAARVYWPRSIGQPSAKAFCGRILAKTIRNIWRRGKFIVFDLSADNHLLIHLRMTGRLHLVAPDLKRSKHEHVVLNFGKRLHLRFHDTRKFGRMFLVNNLEPILNPLGPEPLAASFTAKMLTERLQSRKRLMKPLLLDQTFIAGLGNIYVDEALWEARIHPCRIASSLSKTETKALHRAIPKTETKALHRAIPKVLNRGLKNLGTTLGTGKSNFYSVARHQGRNQDQLKVFRRAGLPCPRCKTRVERINVGQRSTHICPRCQPAI
jgi:formamidopyrimidine-DNA glycosylase